MRNIMLTVAYNGSAYCGWQIQPNGLTVQECVERATEKLTGTRCKVLCAGRTDSGVHATGQVASFRTESKIDPVQFRRGLQRFLPDDITVVRSQEVSSEFHATYSAVRKTYRYLIFDGQVAPPFLNRLVYKSRGPLRVDLMQQALPALLGTHDFRCFETNYPNKATSVRTIEAATLSRRSLWELWAPDHQWQPIESDRRQHEAPDSPLICFEITANGFLYNMVRAIVGTLLRVGTERRPPGYMGDVIASLDRETAGSTAPAEGLYLYRVEYPAELTQVPDNRPAAGETPN